jgi:hypothetical protein
MEAALAEPSNADGVIQSASANDLIPSLEENDPSATAVMAGLDPAIQTCTFRDWMARVKPGHDGESHEQ